MSGKVRIIGGHLRGRVLKVIDHQGLRPTADRVRETLFNWLGQRLDDMVCVDLFAGSGALGLEALSRGAKKVFLNEKSKIVFESLKSNYDQFSKETNLGECQISPLDAVDFIKKFTSRSIDIFFIDPPFSQQDLLNQLMKEVFRVVKNDLHSFIYLEHPKEMKIESSLTNFEEFLAFWEIGRTIRSGMATGTLLVPKKI